jgi:hypothetical protein
VEMAREVSQPKIAAIKVGEIERCEIEETSP